MRRVEGWSLAELVLVVVILGILGAFVAPIVVNAMRAYDSSQTSVATYSKMRYAIERLSREVREVRRSTANSALFDISSMTAATLTFFKYDGTEVTVAGSGATLTLRYLNSTNVAAVLTDQVSSFSLAYFQTDASTTPASSASLAFVQLALTLADGTATHEGRVRWRLRNTQ